MKSECNFDLLNLCLFRINKLLMENRPDQITGRRIIIPFYSLIETQKILKLDIPLSLQDLLCLNRLDGERKLERIWISKCKEQICNVKHVYNFPNTKIVIKFEEKFKNRVAVIQRMKIEVWLLFIGRRNGIGGAELSKNFSKKKNYLALAVVPRGL